MDPTLFFCSAKSALRDHLVRLWLTINDNEKKLTVGKLHSIKKRIPENNLLRGYLL